MEAQLNHLLCCTRLSDDGIDILDIPGGARVVDVRVAKVAEGEGFLLFRYGGSRACHALASRARREVQVGVPLADHLRDSCMSA